MSRSTAFVFALVSAGLFFIDSAFASGGGSLPWEGPLQQIQASINGPVAGAVGMIAVAVAGAMLIFGGELNDFARRLAYVVLVLGVLLGASTIVGLFGSSGASVGLAPEEHAASVELAGD
ncbi:TrbC/VirB2 family protein [Roseibium alexandrii]|uniref:TrbC/VirB2 family protein n=1 Tax=Roseibium alexandrii TaxID=388408 RepID=UPI0037507F36